MSMLDALLSLPSVLSVEFNRAGTWAAWELMGPHPHTEVYAAPTDGSATPVRLTNDTQPYMLIGWHPRQHAVIVGQDDNGNERFQLFMLPVDSPTERIRLTEPDPQYFIWGCAVHPTEDVLFYAANIIPDAGLDDETRITETFQVIRHDLQTGERRALTKPERAAFFFPELNRDGTALLYARNDKHPAARDLWIVDSAGKTDRLLFSAGADKKAFGRWMQDARHVVVRAETETDSVLSVIDTQTGDQRQLPTDPARNFEAAYAPDGTDHILVYELIDSRIRGVLLHHETGAELSVLELPGNLVPQRMVGDDWLCVYYHAKQPRDLIRLRPDGTYTSISKVWDYADLSAADLAGAEDFRWTSVDGLPIQGWLFRAQGDTVQGTVVLVHGGPTDHFQDMARSDVQYLTLRGFHVLAPNYRGSTGFSLAFREAIIQTGWGGLEQEDIRTGIEALIAAGIAERGKVGVMGTSYGGYSAWHAITHFDTDTVAAAAPICGMTDLVSDYYNTRPDLRPYSEEMIGGTPETAPDRYKERSPINFVHNIQGRVLVVQGLQDTNVTPAQVRAMNNAMQDAGVAYETLAFDDEGHGIMKRENQRVLYDALARFFSSAFEA